MESRSVGGRRRGRTRSAADELFAGGGEMGTLMRAHDWSGTPLGPVEQWPQSLRTFVGIMLSSRYPMFVFWGPQLANLYNDGYRPILGATKHPWALGRPGPEVWPEIWDTIGPMVEQVCARGEATWSDDLQLFMHRNGYLEEVYFTFSYSPVRIEGGGIGGMFCACTETTGEVLARRRVQTLQDLVAGAMEAKTVDEACQIAADALGRNPADIPFALLYLLTDDGARARLVAAAGNPPGASTDRRVMELAAADNSGDAWPLAASVRAAGPVVVGDLADRFGSFQAGPWPEPPHTALALPIAATGQDRPAGLLVAGISSRRALDDEYRRFLETAAGHIAGSIAVARAYEDERRRAEALAELDRAKTAFFSDVSHELRTPLTLLLNPIDDALADTDYELPAPQRQRLEVAHRGGLRLLRLVNTLLDFSRIESGRVEAVYEPTDLAAYTAELASAFRSAVERTGLRLVVDCPPLPEPVYVDCEMWEKIVLNLLSNAFKHTFEGEIAVLLRADEGPGAALEVRDTGIGIPPDELPNIFERFHRVRSARSRTHEGTGIGLALVRELARLHGGDIAVRSALGRGSTFTVSVPLGSAHLPADRIAAKATLASTATGPAPYVAEALRWLPDTEPGRAALVPGPRSPVPGPGWDAARVLLVDDNADLRDYLRRELSERFRVEVVADGSAALEPARRRPPDLVLSDVMMPGLDGFELLRALRTDERTRDVPIILLSARAGEEARVEGLEAGADDFLTKPFSARELIARVSAQIELARIRRESTERERRNARENARLHELAQKTILARDRFLATVSHDLKTPLASVKGFTQILARQIRRSGTTDPEKTLATLDRVDAEATRMAVIIDELLTLARSREPDAPRDGAGPIDLAALARAVAARHQQLTTRHAIRLEVPEPGPVGAWDPIQLDRAVSNLLSNAIKYSPNGGEVRVVLSRESVNGAEWATIAVHDRGIGIPEADLERIFEPFHRADNVEGRIAGTGIGLSSTRQVVEEYGGALSATTREGEGSTFTIRLPLTE